MDIAPMQRARRMSGALLAAMTLWAAMACWAATPVAAQDFPQRPITLVLGHGAGGGTDIYMRIYAEAVSRYLGQRIVVDNRSGAGGAVAASTVQQAAPDGYTLLGVSGLQHAYLPASQPVAYEPLKGFAPVTLLFEIVSALAVPEDNPARTIAALIEYGRKKPGGLSAGSPGPGTPPHLFGAMITEATGVPVQVIQYRGSTTIMTDLAAGRIDFAFPTYGVGQPFLTTNKIRGLAVAADSRWDRYPELPTMLEAGIIKHMVAMWYGLLAPAGTPAPVLRRLHDAFIQASRDPDLVQRLTATGTSIRTSTPEEMRSLMVTETTNVESMIKRLGLRAQ
jgi:tripartite-type tricarboxylate transporter receptor subunit TctC